MHVLAALLLIASTSSAPTLPELPEGLPPAQMTPCEGCCDAPGVWLPEERADAIDAQRQECKVLPERCQASLDVCEAEKQLERSLGRIDGLEEGMKAPWSDRLIWGLGGVVIGALIGVIVGLEVTH